MVPDMRTAVLGIFCALAVSKAAFARAVEPLGDVTGAVIEGVTLTASLSSGGAARIEMMDDGIVRVRVAPGGDLGVRETGATAPGGLDASGVNSFEAPDGWWFVSDAMSVQVLASPFRVVTFHGDGTLMSGGAVPSFGAEGDTTTCAMFAPDGEGYYGLGQRGGPPDRRGRVITMRNTDEFAYGEFTDPHYQSYPLVIPVHDERAYGVFVDAAAYCVFDMAASEPDAWSISTVRGGLDYYIIAGPTMDEVLGRYGRLTGFAPLPPLWTLGYQHSRYGWQSAQEVLGIAQTMRDLGFPCDALYFDIDYMDRYHHFTWDPVGFPDPVGLNQQLDSMGFRRVYMNEPCVVTDDPIWAGLDAARYFIRDDFEQSVVTNIFMGDVSWIDFSKEAVREWYKQQLGVFMSVGVSALWNDLNEPASNQMPFAIYDFDGEPRREEEARNIYALLENRMAYEAQIAARPGVRPWNLSRAGFSGIQRYAATWSGDSNSSFEALRVAVQMSINMGLSGVVQFGHDTGGFLGSPSPELFVRWLEFSSFTPMLRNHSINTADAREPWLFGEPHSTMIRERLRERYRWLPMLYSLLERASRTGAPVIAPMVRMFPGDAGSRSVDDQFLLGDDIIVAPVVEEGAVSRSVYLPGGSAWFEFVDGRRHDGGGSAMIDAPLGEIPVLVRGGGAVVRGGVREFADQVPESPDLIIDAFPEGSRRTELYEDDGVSFGFKEGKFRRTEIVTRDDGLVRGVAITRTGGAYRTPDRAWVVRFRAARRPLVVTIDGVAIPECAQSGRLNCWYYDAAGSTIEVRTPDDRQSVDIACVIPERALSAPRPGRKRATSLDERVR